MILKCKGGYNMNKKLLAFLSVAAVAVVGYILYMYVFMDPSKM